MVDYVRDPPHITILVAVAQRGWSGQICDLPNLLLSVFIFAFSSRAQVAFLDQYGRSICQNACFRPRICLLGVPTISHHIWRSAPQNISPKMARISISQPNPRNRSHIAITDERICVKFHRRIAYNGHYRKMQNWVKGGREWVT